MKNKKKQIKRGALKATPQRRDMIGSTRPQVQADNMVLPYITVAPPS